MIGDNKIEYGIVLPWNVIEPFYVKGVHVKVFWIDNLSPPFYIV